MRIPCFSKVIFCCAAVFMAAVPASAADPGVVTYAEWENGPSADPSYFPIAVWLQDPSDAEAYKNAGVNLYVGLWQGPTKEQLDTLRNAGMQTVCHQNETGLSYPDRSVIVGWMHGDEPDNAQRPIINNQWSPPVLPEKIIADYNEIKDRDPSRPVFINLGQGVAWNDYIGRGVRRNHPGDYREYAKGGDIVSFDIYPVTHRNEQIAGNLWYVAEGVERLRRWTDYRKIIWNCIETTKIRAPRRPTPHELRAEVWMSIIHGSRGIIYFVHEWEPETDNRRLLHDPEMLAAVTEVNNQIHALAPVLNTRTWYYAAEAACSNPLALVDVMVKRHDGATYLFAVNMRNEDTDASFLVSGAAESARASVLGESRELSVESGSFVDHFAPWDVHLYRIQ